MILQGDSAVFGAGSLPALLWFSWAWVEIEWQIPDLCGNRKQGCCFMVRCMEKI